MKKNYFSFQVVIITVLVLLLIGTFRLQVFNGASYKDDTNTILTNYEKVGVERGRILDSQGNLLANDEKVSYLLINNKDALDTAEITILDSANLEGFDALTITNGSEYKILEENDSLGSIKGTEIIEKFERVYSKPYVYSNILGYVGKVDPETLENDSFYEFVDRVGKTHIEKYFESELRGSKGFLFSDGIQQVEEKGIRGNDLILTINSDWQEALSAIIAEYQISNGAMAATGLIMDKETGAIVSMAEVPTFDNNTITKLSSSEYNALSEQDSRPLLNKNIGFRGAPGSIFKIVTAYNLLEYSDVNQSTTVFSDRCLLLGTGVEFCEFDNNFYGNVDLTRAFVFSSNIYFCDLLSKQANLANFGLSQELLGVTGEHALPLDGGTIGTIDGPSKRSAGEWFLGDTCNAAIGQGKIQVTPYNALLFTTAALNNGVVTEPYLVEALRDPFGNTVFTQESVNAIEISSDVNAFNQIKQSMRSAITDQSGALYSVFKDYDSFNIHGKTGTAESGYFQGESYKQTIHGWFVGEFEFENRTYTFVFHLHHGGGGYNTSFILKDFLSCLQSDFTDEICK